MELITKIEAVISISSFRLEAAVNENKFQQIKNHCLTLTQMWSLPSDDEILSQINHENMITLKMIKKRIDKVSSFTIVIYSWLRI